MTVIPVDEKALTEAVSTVDLLKVRPTTHGVWEEVANIQDALLYVMENHSRNWASMPPSYRGVIREVFHKLARIGSGDMHFPEHWLDGSNYFRLGLREAERITEANRPIPPAPEPPKGKWYNISYRGSYLGKLLAETPKDAMTQWVRESGYEDIEAAARAGKIKLTDYLNNFVVTDANVEDK